MNLLLHMILADVKLTETTSSDDLQGTFKIPALDEGVTSTSQVSIGLVVLILC